MVYAQINRTRKKLSFCSVQQKKKGAGKQKSSDEKKLITFLISGNVSLISASNGMVL
jgi:hypothetical protein